MVAARYGRRSRPALQEVQQRIAEVTAEVEENISGVRVVKSFAAEPRQLERFRGTVGARVRRSRCSRRGCRPSTTRSSAFLPNLGLAVILLVGGRQVINGSLTLGDFTAFYTYLLMLIGPMRMLGVALGLAQRATASGARLLEILDREPRIVVAGRAAAARRGAGGWSCATSRSRYGDGRAVAARRRPGRRGRARRSRWSARTGSGKTTLVQLLPRLYDPQRGRGADRRRRRALGRPRRRCGSAIAIVDDDPFLFSDTVAGNIAYARPDATREEIERAAERAQAAGFIAELPDGYDTRVGERGLTLSGGQRQRIAIARAFLADPRMLILDDATSSVDASTEREIKAALREVMAGAHDVRDRPPALDDRAGRRHRRARARARSSRAARTRSCSRSPTLYARDRRPRACRTRCSSTAIRGEREVARPVSSAASAQRPARP